MILITFAYQAPKIIYPLNIAIIENNKAMVKELLSKGAFLDVLDQVTILRLLRDIIDTIILIYSRV